MRVILSLRFLDFLKCLVLINVGAEILLALRNSSSLTSRDVALVESVIPPSKSIAGCILAVVTVLEKLIEVEVSNGQYICNRQITGLAGELISAAFFFDFI